MAKSLQEQMLEMGLVNQKKAKKNAKEMKKTEHKRRTGDDADLEDSRAAAEATRKAKAEKDRELNRQREEAAQQKAIAAQIRQLIQTNAIEANGDIKYNFVATSKKVKAKNSLTRTSKSHMVSTPVKRTIPVSMSIGRLKPSAALK